MEQSSFSLWHWLIVLGIGAMWAIPQWRIARRAGLSPWPTVVCAVPLFGIFGAIIVMWWLAFAKWPREG